MSSTKIIWIGLLASFLTIFFCVQTHKDNIYMRLFPHSEVPMPAMLHYAKNKDTVLIDARLNLAASNGILSHAILRFHPEVMANLRYVNDVKSARWESAVSGMLTYANTYKGKYFYIDAQDDEIVVKGSFENEIDKKGFEAVYSAFGLLHISDKTTVEAPHVTPVTIVEDEEVKVEEQLAQTQEKINTILTSHRVNFAYSSAMLTEESRFILDDILKELRKFQDIFIEVSGHTDARGSSKKNKILSTNRARAVKDYLVQGGVDFRHISATGYGDTKPFTGNSYAKENRRVEIKIKRIAKDVK